MESADSGQERGRGGGGDGQRTCKKTRQQNKKRRDELVQDKKRRRRRPICILLYRYLDVSSSSSSVLHVVAQGCDPIHLANMKNRSHIMQIQGTVSLECLDTDMSVFKTRYIFHVIFPKELKIRKYQCLRHVSFWNSKTSLPPPPTSRRTSSYRHVKNVLDRTDYCLKMILLSTKERHRELQYLEPFNHAICARYV
jgi:hypothetical protein